MQDVRKHTFEVLAEDFVENTKEAQSQAVKAAKKLIGMIELRGEAESRAYLKKTHKVSDCTVKNAMQLVWAYDAVVAPGHADEAWFDQLLYAHAVEVRRAIAKVGIAKVVEAGLFKKSAKANMIEFELLADTGLNRAERIAADEAKVEADLVAAKKAKDAAPPAETAKPAAKAKAEADPAPGAVESLETPKPGKGQKSVLEQFDALVTGAEKFIEAVVPGADDLTVETLKNRVTALMVKVNAAVEARAVAAKKAA